MKKILVLFLIFLAATSAFALDIKNPNVAGQFYPSESSELKKLIGSFIEKAEVKPQDADIRMIIVPHAGYIYSGSTAGFAFKAIKDKDFKTVVIVGPSHHASFDGISVYESGIFKTPLGGVAIDEELAKKFTAYNKKIFFYPKAFAKEHSVETEIPFLQSVLRDFKIVPIVFGDQTPGNIEILGKALTDTLKDRPDVLLVISTDLSHYHNASSAKKLDTVAIEKIKALDFKGLSQAVSEEKSELCGFGGVLAGLAYAEAIQADSVEILKYSDSGDITGDKNSVVGYFSAVFYKNKKNSTDKEKSNMPLNSKLSQSERKRLLEIARISIESYVRDRIRVNIKESDLALSRIQGAFVTLTEDGELRGCIGQIQAALPLYKSVSEMAIEAATGDPRFMPVTAKELSKIHIEISVLSPLVKVASAEEIVLGKHGVIVKKGPRSGVFLPQVAGETGWSKEEFLSYLCAHKAGLPENAWKNKDTELYVFTAEVFGEDK